MKDIDYFPFCGGYKASTTTIPEVIGYLENSRNKKPCKCESGSSFTPPTLIDLYCSKCGLLNYGSNKDGICTSGKILKIHLE